VTQLRERETDDRAAIAASDRAFPVGWGRLAIEAAVAALIALVYIVLAYDVLDARLSVPLHENFGDGRSNASWIKGVTENGWWLHNPNLGAPFGQNNHDFPLGGETGQVLVLKTLGAVLPSYAEVMNVYYLTGYGVLTVVALLILRHLRFSYAVSLPIALAYTFLPFHLYHQQAHLTRSTYVTAALACLLLLWVLSWREWFLRVPEEGASGRLWQRVRGRRLAFAVAMTVVIGATETMTTIFTATLLGATAIVTAVRWRDPARLVVGFGFIAVLAATFVLVNLPSFNFWRTEGRNEVAGARLVTEGERFGLKLSNLVLPDPGHRLDPLAEAGSELQQDTIVRSEAGQALGTLATIGFLAGLIGLLGSGLRRRPDRDRGPPAADRTFLRDHASLIALLAVLCATVAGFSNVIAAAGFDQVRTWNRIVVIIGFTSLIVTAIGIEWLLRRVGGRRRTRWAAPAACVALCAFALFDSPPPLGKDYAAYNASWDSDEAFADAIDARMPDDAANFQWPAYPYPETVPPGTIADYDGLRPYLHDDSDMRWSYGAVKGRPRADWQRVANDQVGPIGSLPGMLGLGFSGYWIDTFGYDAPALAALRKDLDRTLRVDPIVSPDGRFLYYDLRPYRARLGRSQASLRDEAGRLFGI